MSKEPTKDDIIKAYSNEIIRLTEWVKRLKEQLNEANEVIKHYADGSIYLFPTWYNGSFEANNYLEKWGVK